MELAADISGVCSVAGTLLMTSKPTQRLSTKMVTSTSSAGYDTGSLFFGIGDGGVPPDYSVVVGGGGTRAGCTTVPPAVTITPACSSSSRSMLSSPSVISCRSSALMLRAYIAEAAAGMVEGSPDAPMIVTPFSVTTVSPGTEPATLPPSVLAPMSTMTAPAAISLSASSV